MVGWRAIAVATLMVVGLGGMPMADALVTQDDAGSGQDAPDSRTPDVWIQSEVLYHGNVTGPGTGDAQDNYAFTGAVGDTVQVRAFGATPCIDLYRPDGSRFVADCNVLQGPIRVRSANLDQTGTWFLTYRPVAADAYRFSIGINGAAADPAPAGLIPSGSDLAPGGDPSCGGLPASETTATHGAGDAAFPDMVWAATKTGFRAVIAWQTDALATATIAVDLSGGNVIHLSDATPRQRHIFILDDLPIGEVLCFRAATDDGTTVTTGDPHGFTLRNGRTSYDGTTGKYTLNTLSLANEAPSEKRIIDGTRLYGELLYDATDGHVKPGRNIILFLDSENHNSGWATCFVTGSILLPNVPPCVRHADILYTNDAFAAGAASTQKDAITDPDGAIWMNWYWQGAPLALDNTGLVLMHEMGHYAFGAMDLYVGNQNCWDPVKKLSIMGSSRSAREFDDDINQCPDASSIPGYTSTWTLAQERYPNIPNRTTILPGPFDGGPENFVNAFSLLDAPVASLEDDDAGSGGDAGSTSTEATPVQPGTVYQGNSTSFIMDPADWYSFDATTGDEIQLRFWTATAPCVELRRPDVSRYAGGCDWLAGPGTSVLGGTADATGTWFIRIAPLAPDHYRFSVGVGAAAPEPGPI